MEDSLTDDSREQTRKAQLAKDREVTCALWPEYDSQATRYPIATQDFVDAIKKAPSDADLVFDNIVAWVKSFHSLRQKAPRHEADDSYVYPDLWYDIHDTIGVRVTTYHSAEIPAIMDTLKGSLIVLRTIDETAEIRISGRLGCGSQHLIYKVPTTAPSELAPYADMQFEVQLRTMLQHAWAEFEHDIRYKTPEGATDPRIDRTFVLAAGLIEFVDQQSDQVVAVLEGSTSDDSAQGEDEKPSVPARTTADDIVMTEEAPPGVLTTLLPDAPCLRSGHHGWAEELLERNSTRTVEQLRELLNPQRLSVVSKAMKCRFNLGYMRIIGDSLLAVRSGKHIETTTNTSHNPKRRPARLRARLQQLAEAGMPMSDAPEDDRADNDRTSQVARYRGRVLAPM